MKTNKLYKQIALSLLLLVGMAGTAWGQDSEAVKGDKYEPMPFSYINKDNGVSVNSEVGSATGHDISLAFDEDEDTYWYAQSTGTATITIQFTQEVTFGGISMWRSGNPEERAKTIKIKTSSDGTNWSAEPVYSKIDIPKGIAEEGASNDRYTFTFPTIKAQYVQLVIESYNSSIPMAINEITFIPALRHKPAKWHEDRNGSEEDVFDDDIKYFLTEEEDLPEGILKQSQIQATHTYIDTIYAHKGTSVELTLPDYLRNDISIQSFQFWYSFRTGGTFETQYTDKNPNRYTNRNEVDYIKDLLTPKAEGYYARMANGYLGSTNWENFGSNICTMNFYIPTDDEFEKMFPNSMYEDSFKNWYVVACDVSGYTDYGPPHIGPTLSHRIIYYIHAVEDENSWYHKAWDDDSYLEEYEINMPFTRLPDTHKDNDNHSITHDIYEMVALSKDARSYVNPDGDKDEKATLAISLVEGKNTAGIELKNTSISGTEKAIFFDYPVTNEDGTKSVNSSKDGNIPSAEIIVKNGEQPIAHFTLRFTKGTSLMTQSMIAELEKEDNEEELKNKSWGAYRYRTPKYLEDEENGFEFVTGLDFDFDATVKANQDTYYPYPLGWNNSSYAFYDGSESVDNKENFIGENFPEWGYYSIMNKYLEVANPSNDADTWGWIGHTKAPEVKTTSMKPRGDLEQSRYHMFIDASDRPGIIARLPFTRSLCKGSELYVSAWVKSAKWNDIATNAAMLFTFMGVTENGEYVPLYRHQTGQMPATYMATGIDLPGFDTETSTATRKNEWFQIAFSFAADEKVTSTYTDYVLQIENNSSSTSGGDMYLDDVRVYVRSLQAQVTQGEPTCDDRPQVNMKINWEQLRSRLSGYQTSSSKDEGIDFCVINKRDYEEALVNDNYAKAIKKAMVYIGNGLPEGQEGSYNSLYGTLYFKWAFEENAEYGNDGNVLAKDNPNNDEDTGKYFLYRDDNNNLTVDFKAQLLPSTPYILLLRDHDGTELTPSSFVESLDPECGLHTEFEVYGQNLITMNGEAVTTDKAQITYCVGQTFEFAVQLQVEGDDGEMEPYTNENIYYDWFFGTPTDYTSPTYTIKNDKGQDKVINTSVEAALSAFRGVKAYRNAEVISETETPVIDGTFTSDHFKLLKYLSTNIPTGARNPQLILHRKANAIRILETGLQLVIQPINIEEELPEGDKGLICWKYCSLDLSASESKTPLLGVGFEDVSYPNIDENPGIRIGLKQIQEVPVEENGEAINIPLRNAAFADGDQSTAEFLGKLRLIEGGEFTGETDDNLYLNNTNDPVLIEEVSLDDPINFDSHSISIGKLLELKATPGTKGEMKIQFYSASTTDNTEDGIRQLAFKPREGYWYQFGVHFEERTESDQTTGNISDDMTGCYGNLIIKMHVVPEYQKWIGEATDNWNNDDNWVRSTKDELKKADDNYTDYTTEDKPTDRDHAGYVPMKFTKVTIPGTKANEDAKQVELYAVTENAKAKQEGGSHTIWDLSIPTDGTSSIIEEATSNIEYDLMVKNTLNEEGNAYECETYYTNTVDQIHFEPKAEMLHAELLTYNTAWVDYKLTKGQWYTLASPLQGVVAGDFYTDGTVANDNNIAGIENQEYFTPITFEKDEDAGYNNANNNSRFSPSVYQRGWKADGATMVGVGEGDSDERAIAGNWSAVYNNVYDEYKPGEGFSLKVLDMPSVEGKEVENAIFRLPKADNSYSYYTVGDDNQLTPSESNDDNSSMPESRTNAGKLQITPNGDAAESLHTVTLSGNNQYYLIGNPFMAHLDAKEFFDGNSGLAKTYWYEEDGIQNVAAESNDEWISTLEGATIPPLHSFFVRKANNTNGDVTVTFKKDMQVLGTATEDETNTNALILTAQTADGKTSRAAIAYDATAKATYETDEDAELFLDSNLSDVPTIYTVAGTMATSINRTSELYNIPVGIYGNSTEMVTLSFEGLNHFSSATLYDAEEKTETPLHEGTTLTVPASTSGRYFLRAGTPTANEVIETSDIQIYTLSSNRVMVTSNVPLKDIRVYTMNGAQVKHTKAGVCSFELYLADGIYLITAQNASGETQTEKVVVR